MGYCRGSLEMESRLATASSPARSSVMPVDRFFMAYRHRMLETVCMRAQWLDCSGFTIDGAGPPPSAVRLSSAFPRIFAFGSRHRLFMDLFSTVQLPQVAVAVQVVDDASKRVLADIAHAPFCACRRPNARVGHQYRSAVSFAPLEKDIGFFRSVLCDRKCRLVLSVYKFDTLGKALPEVLLRFVSPEVQFTLGTSAASSSSSSGGSPLPSSGPSPSSPFCTASGSANPPPTTTHSVCGKRDRCSDALDEDSSPPPLKRHRGTASPSSSPVLDTMISVMEKIITDRGSRSDD